MTEAILYSFRRCPYAIRARLALAVSGIAYELREVDLAAKPAAMLAASPKGTVPVMVLGGGRVIDESLAIMRWALALNDPETWLERGDDELVTLNDDTFKHHLDRYKYPDRFGSDAPAHRAAGLRFLALLEERLRHAPHLSGPARGFTDAAILPFVRQFAAVEPAWFADQQLQRLEHWLRDHQASRLFQSVMVRAKTWAPEAPSPHEH